MMKLSENILALSNNLLTHYEQDKSPFDILDSFKKSEESLFCGQIFIFNKDQQIKLQWYFSNTQEQDFFQELLNVTAGKIKDAISDDNNKFKISLPKTEKSLTITNGDNNPLIKCEILHLERLHQIYHLKITYHLNQDSLEKIKNIQVDSGAIDLL